IISPSPLPSPSLFPYTTLFRSSPSRLARIRLRPLLAALAALLVLSSCSQIKEQAGDVVEHAIEDAVTGLDLTDGVPEDFPTEARSEEHTSELQSRFGIVCRLRL